MSWQADPVLDARPQACDDCKHALECIASKMRIPISTVIRSFSAHRTVHAALRPEGVKIGIKVAGLRTRRNSHHERFFPFVCSYFIATCLRRSTAVSLTSASLPLLLHTLQNVMEAGPVHCCLDWQTLSVMLTSQTRYKPVQEPAPPALAMAEGLFYWLVSRQT